MNFRQSLFLFCLVLGMAGSAAFGQRNVLLLVSDDLGYDYTPCWGVGASPAPMPRITALRDSGVLFRNFWATPACSPTRSSFMTGRYPFRTGVGGAIAGTNTNSISATEWLIPKVLSKHPTLAYRTALIGKYHISSAGTASPTGPFPMGWGYYAGMHLGALPNYFNWNKTINTAVAVPCSTYATTQNVNDAIAWLDSVNGPWVLCIAFNSPHNPYHLPPNDLHSFDTLSGTQTDIANNPLPYFKAMCEALDTEIGRLADSMSVRGLLDSTLILYITDNGTNSRFLQPPIPGNQGKGTLYESGIKVPLIAAGNGVTARGQECYAMVSIVDIFTTVLQATGLPPDSIPNTSAQPIDGRDIFPYFQNPNLPSGRSWLYSETFNNPVLRNGVTAKNDRYHLILYDNEPPLFFDLQNDPFETANLLSRQLTAFEIAQYNLLCDSIVVLTGKPSSCSTIAQEPSTKIPSTAIKIYPNPGRDFLSIWLDSNELEQGFFRVFNSQGKEILPNQSILAKEVTIIRLSGWSSGIYIFEITIPNRDTVRRKILIE